MQRTFSVVKFKGPLREKNLITSVTSNRTTFLTGIFLCLAGAILFSTKAIIVKMAYRDTQVDAVTLLALRMLFSLPFFLASAWATSSQKNNKRFTTIQWMQIMLVGVLGYYVSSLLDFLGLQYVSANIERLILFIYPTIVLLITATWLKEKISRMQWIALCITYTGLLLAFCGDSLAFTHQQNFVLGASLIFGCTITYALYIVGSGQLIPRVGAAKFNSYAMTFACAAVLLHYTLQKQQNLFTLSAEVYQYSLVMALVSTVVPSFLISAGIKRVGADNAAIVGTIGPVSTIIQAHFLLGEGISVLQILGAILILVGVLLIGKKS